MRHRHGDSLAVAAVVLLVAVTGCVGGGEADVGASVTPDVEPADTNRTGEEVLASALGAAEEVETYRFESETRMDLAAFFDLSVTMNTTGKFDRANDAARAHTDGEGGVEFLSLSGGEGFETTVYRTSGVRYKRVSNGSGTGDWNATETDEPLSPGLEDMARALEDANATVEGVGEVDGGEAHVLSIDTPVEDLGGSFGRNLDAHANGIGNGTDDGGDGSGGDVGSVEAYLWVDSESHRPLRFAYDVRLSFEGEDDDLRGSMEFLVDTRYTGYGDEVEVEEPDGVEVESGG